MSCSLGANSSIHGCMSLCCMLYAIIVHLCSCHVAVMLDMMLCSMFGRPPEAEEEEPPDHQGSRPRAPGPRAWSSSFELRASRLEARTSSWLRVSFELARARARDLDAETAPLAASLLLAAYGGDCGSSFAAAEGPFGAASKRSKLRDENSFTYGKWIFK